LPVFRIGVIYWSVEAGYSGTDAQRRDLPSASPGKCESTRNEMQLNKPLTRYGIVNDLAIARTSVLRNRFSNTCTHGFVCAFSVVSTYVYMHAYIDKSIRLNKSQQTYMEMEPVRRTNSQVETHAHTHARAHAHIHAHIYARARRVSEREREVNAQRGRERERVPQCLS